MKDKNNKNQNDLESSLRELLKKHDPTIIKVLIQKYRPVDFAEVLNDFKKENDVLKVLNYCDAELKTEIFVHLDYELQEYIIKNLPNNDLKPLVKDIYSDDLVEIIDEMPTKVVEKILNVTTSQKRQRLNDILKNDEESAGGNMTVEFIKFSKNSTIAQATKAIYTNHLEFESVDDIFVVDEFGTLLGQVKLKDLVIHDPKKKLGQIMETNLISVQEKADQEEIIQIFKKYDINTLPVINDENKIIGIINSEEVIDVMEKEQTEDMEKLVGITPLGDDLFKSSVWKIFLSRLSWLTIGLLLTTITQILLVVFLNAYKVNEQVQQGDNPVFVVVYLLLPMAVVLASVVGISVNQTTTHFVRILSLNRYDKREISEMIGKEFGASLINIIILLGFNVLRLVLFYLAQIGDITKTYLWYVIIASSVAIFVGMFIATLFGTMLPLLMKRIKLDPATISAPLTTSLTGIITVSVFFGVGLIFFS